MSKRKHEESEQKHSSAEGTQGQAGQKDIPSFLELPSFLGKDKIGEEEKMDIDWINMDEAEFVRRVEAGEIQLDSFDMEEDAMAEDDYDGIDEYEDDDEQPRKLARTESHIVDTSMPGWIRPTKVQLRAEEILPQEITPPPPRPVGPTLPSPQGQLEQLKGLMNRFFTEIKKNQ